MIIGGFRLGLRFPHCRVAAGLLLFVALWPHSVRASDALSGCPENASGAAFCEMVECESFSAVGGWQVDSQFAEFMGSSYLLAHGLGNPVADACGILRVRRKGLYRVWVRTQNWSAPWSSVPAGTFRVLIDGKELPEALGAGDGAWHWQLAGALRLEAGPVSVALRDETGFDGRCDAILLSGDPDFVPPEGEELAAFRRNCGAIRRADGPVVVDFAVVGGGVSGMCAAIAAARLGLKVALVQDRPVLGGCNSSEVRIHLGGRANIGKYPRLGDVLSEFAPDKPGLAGEAELYGDERKRHVIEAETNILLMTGMKVMSVEKDGDRIGSVIARDVRSGLEVRIDAKLFSDCTGDGTVGFLAGADWRYGREGRDETGEVKAPEHADRMTLGATLQWYSVPTDRLQPFPKVPWALRGIDERSVVRVVRGEWNWETGMMRDQISEAERIRDYMLMVIYSNWSWLKNSDEEALRDKFANRRLEWVGFVLGKRESRRLVGDYVLTGSDLRNHVSFADGTACASWPIDLHEPGPKHRSVFNGEPFICHSPQGANIRYVQIPFRCLYSRNVPNLLFAGRDISVTHEALGSVRVMRTCAMLGEVVGMAAAVCRRRSCDPRAVSGRYFGDLERIMAVGVGRSGVAIPQTYHLGPTLEERK